MGTAALRASGCGRASGADRTAEIRGTGVSRIFDTDDASRMRCAIVAVLRALGYRGELVKSDGSISAAVNSEAPGTRLQVRVVPHGDAQLVVSIGRVPGACNGETAIPQKRFFDMLSGRLYLTAHQPDSPAGA